MAQNVATSPGPTFRVQLEPDTIGRRGPGVTGYVYNGPDYRVTNVRLRVEVLDASGQVASESFGWVLGNITENGRGYFFVPVPRRGADYRVNVVSYDLISSGPLNAATPADPSPQRS